MIAISISFLIILFSLIISISSFKMGKQDKTSDVEEVDVVVVGYEI